MTGIVIAIITDVSLFICIGQVPNVLGGECNSAEESESEPRLAANKNLAEKLTAALHSGITPSLIFVFA